MDKEKINELKERQQQLKVEIQLKNLRNRIASQLNYLEQHNFNYKVFYSPQHLTWIESNVLIRKRDGYTGIHGDFQIDVNDIDCNDVINFTKNQFSTSQFSDEFSDILPTNSLLAICYDGGDPELEISLNAFLSNPLTFFNHPETWIITKDKSWIIEYVWDQEVIRLIQLQNPTPILKKKITVREE
ncbi:MAG: hypothetical protein QMB29_09200 [Urechidicola sp.]|jgi:hypothetical protein